MSSAVAGYAYWYYYMQEEETKPSARLSSFSCNKALTYCLTDTTIKAPTSATPSKWIKFYSSCTNCLGSYYYIPGTDAMGDCILRLQIAKTAQDIDDALNKYAQSSDNTCMGMMLKDRKYAPCTFFTDTEEIQKDVKTNTPKRTIQGSVTAGTLTNLYSTIRNAFTENISSATAKAEWINKYKPLMKPDNIGMMDPFLVFFYHGLLESTNPTKVYAPDMIPGDICPNDTNMGGCG